MKIASQCGVNVICFQEAWSKSEDKTPNGVCSLCCDFYFIAYSILTHFKWQCTLI